MITLLIFIFVVYVTAFFLLITDAPQHELRSKLLLGSEGDDKDPPTPGPGGEGWDGGGGSSHRGGGGGGGCLLSKLGNLQRQLAERKERAMETQRSLSQLQGSASATGADERHRIMMSQLELELRSTHDECSSLQQQISLISLARRELRGEPDLDLSDM